MGEPPRRHGVSSVVHLVSGSISASLSNWATQPFDVVKTRMIGANRVVEASPLSSVSSLSSIPKRGIIPTAANIVQTDGVVGLWRGSVPTLWRVAPGAGLYFVTLHELSNAVRHSKGRPESSPLSPTEGLLLGSTARALVATLTCPLIVVKTRFEFSSDLRFGGMFQTLSNIARTEGIRGLWCGLTPSIMRDAPYSGIYLSCYQFLKTVFQTTSSSNSVFGSFSSSWLTTTASGFIAGVIATAATHPFDVSRTRLQLQTASKATTALEPIPGTTYRGLWDALSRIAKEEGTTGLFRGLLPRLMKRSISGAVTWSLYEHISEYIQHTYDL